MQVSLKLEQTKMPIYSGSAVPGNNVSEGNGSVYKTEKLSTECLPMDLPGKITAYNS